MILAKKVASNTFIQILGKAITISFALFGFGLMTRYLGQEGFGYFTTIYAFLAILGILIDFGLQMTCAKLISNPNENESQILSNALTIRLLASIIFLGFAPLIILFFPYPTIIKVGTAVAVLGFVFASLSSTLTSFFQKNLNMHWVVAAEVIAKIIFVLALLGAIALNLGLIGIVGSVMIDSILAFLILFLFASRQIKLKLSFELGIWKKIIGTTWPLALTIALNLIYFKGDIFIMSLMRSQAEVGLYGAPYRVLEVLINIAYLFLGLTLPLMAAAAAIKNYDRLKIIIQSTFDFLVIVAVPLIVGGYFVGRQLMVLMAGPEFVISGDIIKILLLATAAIFVAGLFGYAVVALDKQKEMIKFYAINAIVSIVGYLILIPLYSYWGAAWMTVFTECFILLTAGYVLYRNIHFFPNLSLVGKSIGASIIMAVFLYSTQATHIGITIPLGALIYFACLYWLKGFSQTKIPTITNAT